MTDDASAGKTIVWITGATSGIGAALADTVPWAGSRVISIARRAHPHLESVRADLAEAAGWDVVADHLTATLRSFTGERAVFVHNAFLAEPVGLVGEVDSAAYRRHVLANAAAPLILGEAFLRSCPHTVEAGLVMISSAAARVAYAGRAGYGAGKAAMEQWVRAVRLELAQRGRKAWVVAIRPGAVDTPSLRADAAAGPDVNPMATLLQEALAAGTIDSAQVAARRIWDALPPDPAESPIILQGEMIAPPPSTA